MNIEEKKEIISNKKQILKNAIGGVKKAKVCKRVSKLILVIFSIGAIFYGLIWVPNKTLQVVAETYKLNLENTTINYQLGTAAKLKSERTCELLARQELAKAEAEAKKAQKEVTKEQKEAFLGNSYNTCLYLEGWYTPKSQLSKKDNKKTTPPAKK